MPDPSSWLAETATATAAGGHVRTDDGGLSSALASPLAPHCTGLTPEQLLADLGERVIAPAEAKARELRAGLVLG